MTSTSSRKPRGKGFQSFSLIWSIRLITARFLSAVMVHFDPVFLQCVDQLRLVRGDVFPTPRDSLPRLFDPSIDGHMPRGRRDIPLPELVVHKESILIQGHQHRHVALFPQGGILGFALSGPDESRIEIQRRVWPPHPGADAPG